MTDHRAEADDRTRTERSLEHIGEQLRSVVLELRVGKIPDSLAAIHDLLAERLPKPLVTRDLTDMQDRVNATISRLATLNPGGHVAGPADVHEAGGCEECRPDTLAEALDALPVGTVVQDAGSPGTKPTRWERINDSMGEWRKVGAVVFWDSKNMAQWGAPISIESIPGEDVLPRADDNPKPDRPVWTLKMLREHLCHEQMFTTGPCSDVLQGAINAIDWHRPIGNDGKHGERHTATCGCDITPEPDTETVTLPRGVVEAARDRLLAASRWAVQDGQTPGAAQGHLQAAVNLRDALDAATTPESSATGSESDAGPETVPQGAEGAERPTGANLGRIGWLEVSNLAPRQLAREVSDGWSKDEHFGAGAATWDRRDWTEAAFTPFTPADFGWIVLGDDEVAVKRADLSFLFTVLEDLPHRIHGEPIRRLRAALDGGES